MEWRIVREEFVPASQRSGEEEGGDAWALVAKVHRRCYVSRDRRAVQRARRCGGP